MEPTPIDRRHALALLGGAGAALALAACGSSTKHGAPAASTPVTARAGNVGCVLTPEATDGPYYLDIDKVRSDITEGRPGAPLALTLTVVDASTCAPIKDAAVDVWHCDATGVYSGFDQSPGTVFLRGTQSSDATGRATFHTIYPGWYPGRAVHIHLKVHTGGKVVHTGQLFFDDAQTGRVYQRAPYRTRGTPDTPNANDSIYRDAGAASALVDLTESADAAYIASMTVGVLRQ